MKHLKQFNESIQNVFTQEEIDDIKDVLQDIIDEYSLPEFNGSNFSDDFYKVSFYNNLSDNKVPVEEANIISIMLSAKIDKQHFSQLSERYSQMGYEVQSKFDASSSELSIINIIKLPLDVNRNYLFHIKKK